MSNEAAPSCNTLWALLVYIGFRSSCQKS